MAETKSKRAVQPGEAKENHEALKMTIGKYAVGAVCTGVLAAYLATEDGLVSLYVGISIWCTLNVVESLMVYQANKQRG